jgi:hypothetical protein
MYNCVIFYEGTVNLLLGMQRRSPQYNEGTHLPMKANDNSLLTRDAALMLFTPEKDKAVSLISVNVLVQRGSEMTAYDASVRACSLTPHRRVYTTQCDYLQFSTQRTKCQGKLL